MTVLPKIPKSLHKLKLRGTSIGDINADTLKILKDDTTEGNLSELQLPKEFTPTVLGEDKYKGLRVSQRLFSTAVSLPCTVWLGYNSKEYENHDYTPVRIARFLGARFARRA